MLGKVKGWWFYHKMCLDVFVYKLMTDNYHFDKNSKLFQKFLASKSNKNNESMIEVRSKGKDEHNFSNKNKSFVEKPQ